MPEEIKLRFITDKLKSFVTHDEEEKEVQTSPLSIPIDEIMPNPYQPRRHFDITALEELAESIKQVGIITPISVRKAAYGYELICGERRLRASKIAGLEEIPAIVMDISDKESAIVAITENLQRKELNFFEEAESMQNLVAFHGLTQEGVAKSLGKSQAAIANKLRLLKLPESVRNIINENSLCERHARALLRLPTEELQLAAVKRIADMQLNVTSSERMIQKMLEEEPKKKITKYEIQSVEKKTRLFNNTLAKTIEMLKKGGLSPVISQNDNEDFVEYIIKIAKR